MTQICTNYTAPGATLPTKICYDSPTTNPTPTTPSGKVNPNDPVAAFIAQASASIAASGVLGGTTVPIAYQFQPTDSKGKPLPGTIPVYVYTDPSTGKTDVTKTPKTFTQPASKQDNTTTTSSDTSGLPSIWLVVAGVLFLVVLIKMRSH